MLSRRLTRTLAACAATLALASGAPAFAGQGSTRSASNPQTGSTPFAPHQSARIHLRPITAFNGATLDPNGVTVDPNGTPTAANGQPTTSAGRPTAQPDGQGIAIDPNG